MIDIYNEEGYIRNIIEGGLAPDKWKRDLKLIIRYWREYEGMTLSQCKKKAKDKIRVAKGKNPDFPYDEYKDFKTLDKTITSAYRCKDEIRKIRSIDIPKDVIDWFLNLEKTFEISEEKAEDIRSRRKKVHFKGTHPINFDRTKYLFTLYIWTRIQETYLNKDTDRPNVHYLRKYLTRFKQDALLAASFKMEHEGNLLYDLGLIDINFSQGITTTFMDKYDVFKIPVTNDNKITILTGEPKTASREILKTFDYEEKYMTLYNPGYWLTVQKFGTFVCDECGKMFIHYSLSSKEKTRKYCKTCAKIKHNKTDKEYEPTQWCVDCGKLLEDIKPNDRKTCRCRECQDKRRREKNREYKQISRERLNSQHITASS